MRGAISAMPLTRLAEQGPAVSPGPWAFLAMDLGKISGIAFLSLVGDLNPSEKYESIGIMTFPIYGKIIQMFQTTNQFLLLKPLMFDCDPTSEIWWMKCFPHFWWLTLR